MKHPAVIKKKSIGVFIATTVGTIVCSGLFGCLGRFGCTGCGQCLSIVPLTAVSALAIWAGRRKA